MSGQPQSFIHIKDLKKSEIDSIFARAWHYLKGAGVPESSKTYQGRLTGDCVGLVFFENSTRTRMSFEAAAAGLGYYPMLLDSNFGSSLEKGETEEDTLHNIAAMGPRLLVVRCGDHLDLEQVARRLPCPIINAGWGLRGHPSQGLLDLFTILRYRKDLQDVRLLIVGDIIHSRVARSHFELAEKLGYQVAVAGPEEWLPQGAQYHRFSNLPDGLKWANVVMALRVQLERHQRSLGSSTEKNLNSPVLQENVFESIKSGKNWYIENFSLNKNNLKVFCEDGLILHPGPINWGVELQAEVQDDPRQVILRQVESGVFIRKAIIDYCMKESM